MLVGLGLSLVSDTSGRPGHQEVMLFRTKKHFLVIFAIVSTFSTKMDPWSWTPTNPKNFKARRTGFWVRPTWVGGGGGGPTKFWLGRGLGEGKSEDSLWRRDLSALGPFGAQANLARCYSTQMEANKCVCCPSVSSSPRTKHKVWGTGGGGEAGF